MSLSRVESRVIAHLHASDLKGFVKIVSGILILRKRNCTDWTSKIDAQMIAWTQKYITWLETNSLGVEECASLKYVRRNLGRLR